MTNRRMTNSWKAWGQILWPVIAYLALAAGLRLLFVQGLGMERPAAAGWATICLFLPVCLLYQYRWRKDCAIAEKKVSLAAGAVWWLLAALCLAGVSIGAAGAASGWHGAAAFVSTCILGPFIEESLYRGQFIGRGLKTIEKTPLLVMSTLLFAVSHGTPAQMLLALPAGLLLGLLYLKEQRLIGVVLVHSAANILIYLSAWLELSASTGLLVAALAAEGILICLLYVNTFRRSQ